MVKDKSLTDREMQKFIEIDKEQTAVRTINLSSLVPEQYDKIELSYSDDNISQVKYYFKNQLITTLNLTYSDNKLVQIEKV